MSKLTKRDIKLLPAWNKAGLSIVELAKRFEVTPGTISYHIKKAKNNQKNVKTTPKNNHLHRQTIINAKGNKFSYSATIFFWLSICILLAINAFFLWSTYAR